jgi:hypothetical protein
MWKAITRKSDEESGKYKNAYFAMFWIAFFVLADAIILYYFFPAKH